MLNFDVELDLTGLNCPVPVLKLRQALHHLQAEQVIKVICSDPLTLKDVPLLCRQMSVHLLLQESVGSQYLFWVQK